MSLIIILYIIYAIELVRSVHTNYVEENLLRPMLSVCAYVVERNKRNIHLREIPFFCIFCSAYFYFSIKTLAY